MSKGRQATKVSAILILGALGAMLSLGSGCDALKSDAKKAFAEACVRDTDCESNECATYGSICSKGCTYDKDCGANLVCRVKDGGTGGQCSKPSGMPPGPSSVCNTASECQHAQCLKKTEDLTGAGVCSKHCQDASECPAGMKICNTIPDSGALKLCLPGDEKTPAADVPKYSAPKPVASTTKPTDAGTGPEGGTKPADAGAPAPTDAGAPKDGGTTAPTDAGAPKDGGTTAPTDAGTTPADGGKKVRPIIRIPKP